MTVPTPLSMTIEKVMPEIARQWIAEQDEKHLNRRISEKNVRYFVYIIETGQWDENVAQFVFNEDGILIDGSHRCRAIVRTGQAVTVRLMRGFPMDSMPNIDIGRARTAADTLTLDGEANAHSLASALSYLIVWERLGDNQLLVKYEKPSPAAVRHALALNPGMRESVQVAKRIKFGYDGLFAFLHYRLGEVDYQDTKAFFAKLKTGLPASVDTDPIIVLREKLLANKRIRVVSKRSSTQDIQRYTYFAWNRYRERTYITLAKMLRCQLEEPR